jgi:hypothetical protein
MKLSRREFNLLGSSALAALTVPRAFGKGLRIRRNINSLTARELDAFRAGVTAMKALDILDVRHFGYQANVHGAPWGWEDAYPVLPPGVDVYWNQCVHGSTHFLPWHRWYLLYWEQIVRELSGNHAFNLPYWDVTNEPFLPAAVRLPADATNSLYVSNRNGPLNTGMAQVVDVDHDCLYLPDFSDFATGDDVGVEDNPHNMVHNQVGGWLGAVETAGYDPLFFLHHCNIDRFWECWLTMDGTHENPSQAAWLNVAYDFQSTTGPQTPLVSDGLRTSDLGYTYDACPIKSLIRIPKYLRYLVWEVWPLLEIPMPDPPPPYVRTVFTFEPLVLDGFDKAFLLPRAELGGIGKAGSGAFLMSDIIANERVAEGGFYLDVYVAPDASQLAGKGLDAAKRVGSFGNFQLSALKAHGQHNGAHLHHGVTPPFGIELDRSDLQLLANGREPALLFTRRGVADQEGKPLAHDPKAELFKVGALSLVTGK